EQVCELLGKSRLLLEQVESLQAVAQEVGQPQAGQPLNLPVRVPFQDCAQERLVLLAEANGYPLADRAELVASDIVALQEREGPGPRAVLADDLDRPGGGVHLPDRLDQGVQRDRVLGVLLRQLQELLRERVAVLVHTADELQPLRVGQGNTAVRCPVVFLAQRLVLRRWRGRLVLTFAVGRLPPQALHQNQESPDNSLQWPRPQLYRR